MDRYDVELSWEYVHASREFYVDRYGIPQFLGTWMYCFRNMDSYLGDALSSMYVRDHFVDENKQKVRGVTFMGYVTPPPFFFSFFRGGGVKVGIFYFLSFFAGQAHEILDYVKEALIDSTMQNVFMDDVTKSKAKAKVGNINIFVRRIENLK